MISHDSFVRIAHGKRVCQDFAASDNVGIYYGVVSDGCSGAENSQYGAGDLVNSIAPYLYPDCSFQNAFMGACGRADALRSIRGGNKGSLFATLVCVTLDEDKFQSAVGGDGFEMYRRRGTNIYEIRQTEFTANMPAYPIYFLTPDMPYYIANCEIDKNYRIETNKVFDLESQEYLTLTTGKSYQEHMICNTITRKLADYDLGLIFSDGLDSFKDDKGIPVPLTDVLKVFLDFKMLQGNFLQRKMNFAWDEVVKRGWRNTDDFSVAGISHV